MVLSSGVDPRRFCQVECYVCTRVESVELQEKMIDAKARDRKGVSLRA